MAPPSWIVPRAAINEKYPSQLPTNFCRHADVKNGYYKTPTTCFEAKDTRVLESLDTATVFVESVLKFQTLVYPDIEASLSKTLLNYDEPVYPIPVGASIFFFAMMAWITTFYLTLLGRKVLLDFTIKLELFPEAHRFPDLPLYWLQQTKKEADVRREVRNTWAWLARRYLLSPDDPMLVNIDEQVVWHDFDQTRNTQSLINVLLKRNLLYIKVGKRKGGRREYEILKETELDKDKIPGGSNRMFTDLVKRKPEDVKRDSLQSRQGAVEGDYPAQMSGMDGEGEAPPKDKQDSIRSDELAERQRRRSSARPRSPPLQEEEPTPVKGKEDLMSTALKTIKASHTWMKKSHLHEDDENLRRSLAATPANLHKQKDAKTKKHAKPKPAAPKKGKGGKKKHGKKEKGKKIRASDDMPTDLTQFKQDDENDESVKPSDSEPASNWELPDLTAPIEDSSPALPTDGAPPGNTESMQ